jgi:dTDP-4-amino-4,6-dideoxygalactose transaminase
MPARALAAQPPTAAPHSAAVADADLLARIRAACDWWETQSVWRPTSSITGGGAVEAFEDGVAPYCVALPSATSALRLAMQVHGLGPGCTIGVPELDWTSTLAVAREIGVQTRPLPVDDVGLLDVRTLVAQPLLLSDLAAVVATDLHGLTVDIPFLKRHHPGLVVVEDAARSWGARYPDGSGIGTAADSCVFSFGSTKDVAAGELGALVSRAQPDHHRALSLSQHPSRQLLQGVGAVCDEIAMSRVSPTSALMGAHALQRALSECAARRVDASILEKRLRSEDFEVLSDPLTSAPGRVVVRVDPAAIRSLVLMGVSLETGDLRPHPEGHDRAALSALAETVVALRAPRLAVVPRDRPDCA